MICRQNTPRKFFTHLTSDTIRAYASCTLSEILFRPKNSILPRKKNMEYVTSSNKIAQERKHIQIWFLETVFRQTSKGYRRHVYLLPAKTTYYTYSFSYFILFVVYLYTFVHRIPQGTIMKISSIIRWRSISMRAGPAFLQFDWSKASLSMDLPVFVYSHTKTGFKFFQDREDMGSLFLCLELCLQIFDFKPRRENLTGLCFVQTEVCQGLLIIEIVICIHYFIVSSLRGWVMQLGLLYFVFLYLSVNM